MEKLNVRLNDKLDKKGKGFYDLLGKQKLSPKEFGKSATFEVVRTDFVTSKIASGELLLVGIIDPPSPANGGENKEPKEK